VPLTQRPKRRMIGRLHAVGQVVERPITTARPPFQARIPPICARKEFAPSWCASCKLRDLTKRAEEHYVRAWRRFQNSSRSEAITWEGPWVDLEV